MGQDFVFINCHVWNKLHHGKASQRKASEQAALQAAEQAWPRNTGGAFNKGSYTEGQFLNEAVVREGLPLQQLTLEVSESPINGVVSWNASGAGTRLECSQWALTKEERRMLRIRNLNSSRLGPGDRHRLVAWKVDL